MRTQKYTPIKLLAKYIFFSSHIEMWRMRSKNNLEANCWLASEKPLLTVAHSANSLPSSLLFPAFLHCPFIEIMIKINSMGYVVIRSCALRLCSYGFELLFNGIAAYFIRKASSGEIHVMPRKNSPRKKKARAQESHSRIACARPR